MNYKAILPLASILLGASIFGFSQFKSEPLKCGSPEEETAQTESNDSPLELSLNQNFTPPKFYVYGYKGITLTMGDLNALEIVSIGEQPSSSQWWSVSERTVNRNRLLAANTIADLLYDDPEYWLKVNSYSSVWIKTKIDGEQISLMSDGFELSEDQKSLFKVCDIGSDFEITVNYSTTNPETKIFEAKRMDLNLSLVPEQEAEYPEGYKALLDYFENDCSKALEGQNMEGNVLLRIKFSIDGKGKAKQAKITRASGYPNVDEHILTALQKMSDWSPAKNKDGEIVEQEFELVFANVIGGC